MDAVLEAKKPYVASHETLRSSTCRSRPASPNNDPGSNSCATDPASRGDPFTESTGRPRRASGAVPGSPPDSGSGGEYLSVGAGRSRPMVTTKPDVDRHRPHNGGPAAELGSQR